MWAQPPRQMIPVNLDAWKPITMSSVLVCQSALSEFKCVYRLSSLKYMA